MHVAIIMDGNGRWARQRGLPRTAGHVEGVKAVRAAVRSAVHAGVQTLTLYAFSSANWGRPEAEVDALMRLVRRYLITERARCIEQSIRINVIGRRDRLSGPFLRTINRSERLTAAGSRMHLRIVVDYSRLRVSTDSSSKSIILHCRPEQSICSYGPEVRGASATSCCGKSRTQSYILLTAYGQTSMNSASNVRLMTTPAASGALEGSPPSSARPRSLAALHGRGSGANGWFKLYFLDSKYFAS